MSQKIEKHCLTCSRAKVCKVRDLQTAFTQGFMEVVDSFPESTAAAIAAAGKGDRIWKMDFDLSATVAGICPFYQGKEK